MKKRILSILLVIVMMVASLLPVTALAAETEDGSVTVGNGTDTDSYIPTHSLYNYTKSQTIVPASELTALNGKSIIGMSYYPTSYSITRNVAIYLMETDQDVLNTSFVNASGATAVYSGDVQFTADTETHIDFNTPYIYSGGNLLVTALDLTGTWSSGLQFYGVKDNSDADYFSRYAYTDSGPFDLDPTTDSVTGTGSKFRPKMAFHIGYTVTNGTPESAKETNHGYITIDKTSAAEDETVTLTVAPSAGYQLKAGTLKVNDGAVTITCKGIGKYEFTMPAYAVTVTAEFEQIVLPYFFDFESDFIAAGWTNIDADGDGHDWITGTNKYGAEEWGVEGSRCAVSQSYENSVGSFNADNWLFSPAITIPADGAIVSWYEQSQDASYPESYTVYVSETNTSTDTSKMTEIFSGTAANPWNQRSVELEAAEYAGKTVYIAFRHHSYDCYMLEIDNFAVGAEAPAHTHTVTFDANGGSVTTTSAETGTDGKLDTLPTPTRSGSYSFDGWYTMKEGGTKVDTNTVFTAAATIYAHWSWSFSFADLPETGVTNITVPAGNYYTGVAAKDAFILYWGENIKTNGDFLLIDYVDTDINGYHSWMITFVDGVAGATDGGFAGNLFTILDLINSTTSDCWINGTYSAIHTVTVENDGNGTASADTSSAAKGDTVTLTATPNTGYHFKEWQSSDVTVSGDAFTMPEKDVTVKAIFEADAPTTYTVTFNMNGHGTQVADQTVEDGNKATKPADPTAEGWTFGGWYEDAAFNVAFNFDSAIEANTTIYAKWTKNTPAPAPSGDSTPTVTVPITGDENSVKVSATVSGSTATIEDIKDADLAKVTGGESVEIDLTGLKKDVDTAKIPTATVEKIGEQAGMGVKLTTATVFFDKTATQEISDQAKGNTVELVVDDIKEVSLNAVQKEAVQKLDIARIIDAYLVSGGTKLCTEGNGGFNGGKAKVILPYELKSGSTAANYSVYYVAEDGTLEKLNAKYDTALKAFVFDIEHFSNYVVAYDENACPQDETCVYAKFTDADTKAWYHDGVHFCVENGYMQGISKDKFAPSGTLSRAMIVTMLWRLEGEPVVNYAMSFKDVPAGEWYTEAIRWAQSTGVVEGYSAEAFGPDDPISREQMATILYRFAKNHKINVANANKLVGFTDVNKISTWALDAMKWANAVGLVQGRTTTTLVPEVSITRAEAATMVQRYCEAFKK